MIQMHLSGYEEQAYSEDQIKEYQNTMNFQVHAIVTATFILDLVDSPTVAPSIIDFLRCNPLIESVTLAPRRTKSLECNDHDRSKLLPDLPTVQSLATSLLQRRKHPTLAPLGILIRPPGSSPPSIGSLDTQTQIPRPSSLWSTFNLVCQPATTAPAQSPRLRMQMPSCPCPWLASHGRRLG